MKRTRIEFQEFKEKFIDYPDGFFNVYSCLKEDESQVLQLDMICEWRLSDSKVFFVEIPYATKDQLDQLINYLRVTAELLNKAILKRIERLK